MNKIHLIGNAHIDPVWLWQWQEGFSEIKATFRSALDRMKEFDDLVFTSACGAYYMWIEQSDPSMFEEIQKRVREGRWCIVGGWLIQPDCNIPSGESFARHALITQNYFIEKFGRPAKTGYNVDSFGHNGSLPKILKASRMENYVFMRPAPHEKTLQSELFIWESADGSRVKAYRIPHVYCISYGIGTDPFDLFSTIENTDTGRDRMAFYGVGNHGGGPTVELLENMHDRLGERFVYSDPDRYFALQSAEGLPVLREDLQFHAKGCYSAFSEIKKNNRRSENALLEAERLSVLSRELVKTKYPEGELKYAWERVLFNQFHDILGGCSIKEAYGDARDTHGEAISIAKRLQNFACQQISWSIDTVSPHTGAYLTSDAAEELGYPIVIFNSLCREVTMPVHIRNTKNGVRDESGKPVAVQTVRDSKTDGAENRYARLFEAKVSALGYAVYRMYSEPVPADAPDPFTVTDGSIENGRIRIAFDGSTGELKSIVDLESGEELLSSPTEIRLFDDSKNDTWAHGTVFFKDAFQAPISGSAKVIENGPVRATVRTVQSFGASTVTRDYSLSRSGKYIDVKVRLDFREKHRVLKFIFPVNAATPRAVCKIPFGSIERPTDGSEQVCGDWIALSDGSRGITVATDSKHSFDAEGSILSLTVLRSAIFADHYGLRDEFCEFTEQGEQSFAYRISPFTSVSDAEKNAEELQFPLFAVRETFHKGALPKAYGGISVKPQNVTVTAVKQHKSGVGTVLRVYETEGKDTEAEITLFNKKFTCNIPHDGVVTLLVKDGDITVTDFVE